MTTTTAREETTRLLDLLHREHHALAEFLVSLAAFDAARGWMDLGYRSLFDFLRRELKLSAGAAQYRKTAAELVQRHPRVADALRRGDLCLSSVIELSKVLTPENEDEALPRFYGRSSRDAAFIAAAIRPVESPPVRSFVVTPVRPPAAPDAPATDAPRSGQTLLRAPELPRTSPLPSPPRSRSRPRPRPTRSPRQRRNGRR